MQSDYLGNLTVFIARGGKDSHVRPGLRQQIRDVNKEVKAPRMRLTTYMEHGLNSGTHF